MMDVHTFGSLALESNAWSVVAHIAIVRVGHSCNKYIYTLKIMYILSVGVRG